MTLITIFITAYITGFSGAVVPGPLLTVTIAETGRRGILAGPLLIIGHSILEGLMVLGLMFGLAQTLHNQVFGIALSFAGGGVLLWMGVNVLKDTLKGNITFDLDRSKDLPDNRSRGLSPVISGAVTSIANPYWTLWWITFGASFTQKALYHGWIGISTFFIGHILSDFTWYTLVSVLLVTGKKFLSNKVYKYVLIISGLFLIGIALSFIYTGITGNNW